MNGPFKIKKILNNNVVIALTEQENEVVLTGKGIGFNQKQGEILDDTKVDKYFVLIDKSEQEQYKLLVPHVSESFIGVMNEVIFLISEKLDTDFDEHIHIALTDHLSFAIKRLQQGLGVKNPFLIETQTMYPKEYTIAEEVIQLMNHKLNVSLPDGEIGFVALHIHSAVTNRSITELSKYSLLINRLVSVIEDSLKVEVSRTGIDYLRLVRHLRHAIERSELNQPVEAHERLEKVLKEEYPLCYNLSWKLIKIMQKELQTKFPDAEAVYLTMHLQRLSPN
ncbi:glucose PTS transporter transcription antiterminator GlcT [Guptibacillus hwajinpoensis]|uniref:PtsGHI operon antiterminator n=2 Tax=Guptibacillus hwajinpoensis TaxID=208199 RepID=A0A0J6CWG4_9BACL|nr:MULTISPECIES: transcription antiterminator [Alkalihalobacillus]KMM37478.1 PtsGHI operon antiterminator [Alkalihalobacillus macyae]MDQ0481386.1 transcriptional antiterminator [Alkalihalobacillus hemicentroti]